MNIIITGASQGIGYEMVKIAAVKGDHHIIAISRNKQKLKGLEEICHKTNPQTKIYTIPFDLTEHHLYPELENQVKHILPAVDVLINNAAHLTSKPFTHLTHQDIQSTLSTNLVGPLELIQTLLPLIKKSKSPHIVNIGSMGGFMGSAKFSGLSIYSASKGALAILSECLAEELKSDNIKVNCLALGAVNTEMLQQAFPKYKAPIDANQMANFIIDFSLNGHNYFNGKVLPVSLSNP